MFCLRRLRDLAVVPIGLGLLLSAGCMSKPRAPIVQIAPDFNYIDDAPDLVLEEVFAPREPALTAGDFVRGSLVGVGVE
ncbi:MAG: hypothetical protein AAF797_02780 [Planctomycetota bacterium]